VRLQDVPFPRDAKFVWRHQLNEDERKSAFKQLAMRWHPDKFTQKFGPRLCPGERQPILHRVNEVFQAVQAAFKGPALNLAK